MIDALVAGKLYAKPQPHTAKNGNTFATAKVRAATGEEALFVNVIAFDAGAVSALLALDAGDSLAVTGPFTSTGLINGQATTSFTAASVQSYGTVTATPMASITTATW